MTNLTIWTQSRIKYFEKSSYTESDEQHHSTKWDSATPLNNQKGEIENHGICSSY